MAPRNLKAPPRWKLSHFRKTRAWSQSSREREVITGVTVAAPAMRRPAAWRGDVYPLSKARREARKALNLKPGSSRLCDAMIRIRDEIYEIEAGKADRADNVLKGAPHTIAALSSDDWPHKYPRERAAFPAPWLKDHKFWPHVGRVDNPFGDRNLVCTCPPVEAQAE